jgi:hypothetical protein
LLFVEHVRAADGSRLERWQRRLKPAWRAFAYGCRCDQDTVGLIEHGGFAVAGLREERWRGMPPLVRPVVCGQANPAHEAESRHAIRGAETAARD